MTHPIRFSLLAAALSLVACHSDDQKKGGPPPVPVRVATVVRTDAPITVSASGVVSPLQTVNVEAQASGSIVEVAFQQGDWVNKGQVLFRLDPRPMQNAVAQARAILTRDEAQANASQHDAERYETLAKEGYVTQSQAEQTRATAAAQAATVVADRAALQNAEVNLGYATIRAPISGRTGALIVRQGNLVGPGTGPLVVINQLRPIEVHFPVLPADFSLLGGGRGGPRQLPATVTGTDSGGFVEHGQLTFLDNAIDSLTGTVTGRARFENEDSHLWPGQLVFVSVQAGMQRGVMVVPAPAVQVGQQGSYVYVVDQQTKTAQTRPVATSRTVGDMVVVTRGLNAGETVVTDGQSRLNPGSHVVIVAPGAPGVTPGGDTAAASVGAMVSTAGGEVGGAAPNGGAPNGGTSSGTAGARGATSTPGGSAGSNGFAVSGATAGGIQPSSANTIGTTAGTVGSAGPQARAAVPGSSVSRPPTGAATPSGSPTPATATPTSSATRP